MSLRCSKKLFNGDDEELRMHFNAVKFSGEYIFISIYKYKRVVYAMNRGWNLIVGAREQETLRIDVVAYNRKRQTMPSDRRSDKGLPTISNSVLLVLRGHPLGFLFPL